MSFLHENTKLFKEVEAKLKPVDQVPRANTREEFKAIIETAFREFEQYFIYDTDLKYVDEYLFVVKWETEDEALDIDWLPIAKDIINIIKKMCRKTYYFAYFNNWINGNIFIEYIHLGNVGEKIYNDQKVIGFLNSLYLQELLNVLKCFENVPDMIREMKWEEWIAEFKRKIMRDPLPRSVIEERKFMQFLGII